MLETTSRVKLLADANGQLNKATARVSQFWDDRVSAAIDATYVNRIVRCCSQAVSELSSLTADCELYYQRLFNLGR